MKTLLLSCFVIATAHSFIVEPWAGLNKRCNNPEFWCKNMETAKECGVVEYCQIEWNKAGSSDTVMNNNGDAAPIKITLYYESFCGGCREFINTQWYPTYQKLNGSGILELELVPYGNAQEYKHGDKYVYYCQHGQRECVGNLIETCAISHLGKISAWAPFIYCLESKGPYPSVAKTVSLKMITYKNSADCSCPWGTDATSGHNLKCAQSLGIDYSPIETCANGDEGNKLEHEMALKTNALSPQHQYVPWIVVDGVHTEDIQTEVQTGMLEYVCNAYKGTKPAACQSAVKQRKGVCYRD